MKKVINYEGFQKAMEDGETWVVLDCQLSEVENGRWYYEVEKTVFYGDNSNWLKKGKDAETKLLVHGEDEGPEFNLLKPIWENLIEKYSPNEYFVDQHTHVPFPHEATKEAETEEHWAKLDDGQKYRVVDDAGVDIKNGKFTG
jgi:hypothetical protein